MQTDYIDSIIKEVAELDYVRHQYKKQYWISSPKIGYRRRKKIKKLFTKVDRLRNHIKLWLKQIVKNKPTNYDSFKNHIEKAKGEAKTSLKILGKVLKGNA